MKQGQTVKLYKHRTRCKNPYKLIGEFTFQSKTSNFITLKSASGYTESVSIIDLRLKHYRLIIDGQELKLAPIQDTLELEKKQKEIDLLEYRQTVGKSCYESMFHNNKLRQKRWNTNAS